MRHRFLRALTLAGLAATGGCSNLSGPDGPAINVSLAVRPGAAYTMRTDIGDQRIVLSTGPSGNGSVSRDVHGDRYGTLPVGVALFRGGGDSLVALSFAQTFQQGSDHWVSAAVGTSRPMGICIGALTAAPLGAGSTDTLFVMHGGIPTGAVC